MPETIPSFPYEGIPTEWLYSILGLAALFVAVILFLQVYCFKYALKVCGAGERGFLFSAFGIFIATIATAGTSTAVGVLRPESTPVELLGFSFFGTIAAYSILFWISPLRAFAVHLVHTVTSFISVGAATAVFIFGTFALTPQDVRSRLTQVCGKYSTDLREQIVAQRGMAAPSVGEGNAGFLELIGKGGLSEVTNVKAPSNSESNSSFEPASFFFSDTVKKSLEAVQSTELPSLPTYESGIKKNPFFIPSKQ